MRTKTAEIKTPQSAPDHGDGAEHHNTHTGEHTQPQHTDPVPARHTMTDRIPSTSRASTDQPADLPCHDTNINETTAGSTGPHAQVDQDYGPIVATRKHSLNKDDAVMHTTKRFRVLSKTSETSFMHTAGARRTFYIDKRDSGTSAANTDDSCDNTFRMAKRTNVHFACSPSSSSTTSATVAPINIYIYIYIYSAAQTDDTGTQAAK